jgi:nucleoporin NUP159
MLKARMLSPEQTELQTQLRREIRVSRKLKRIRGSAVLTSITQPPQVVQDRVTKMEDHLQASKKKLNEFRTGKPSVK